MRRCSFPAAVVSFLLSYLHDYEALQSLAVGFIYVEIGCALIGSLGALFNGVLMANLVLGLFALVAIEVSSQWLGRMYAVLLFFAIMLDIAWFILFSLSMRNSDHDDKYAQKIAFSLELALWMQIIGFSVRFLSSFVWIQMYRLGTSSFQVADCDGRNSFFSPTGSLRQLYVADEITGGSIYDPTYFSSLFEDDGYINCSDQGNIHILKGDSSSSSAHSPNHAAYSDSNFICVDI